MAWGGAEGTHLLVNRLGRRDAMRLGTPTRTAAARRDANRGAGTTCVDSAQMRDDNPITGASVAIAAIMHISK